VASLLFEIVLELVLFGLGIIMWVLLTPIIYVAVTPVILVAALFSRQPYSDAVATHFRIVTSVWVKLGRFVFEYFPI